MRQEKLISLIENGLQSSHVPSRAAALHASVFLLQSAPNNNVNSLVLSNLKSLLQRLLLPSTSGSFWYV